MEGVLLFLFTVASTAIHSQDEPVADKIQWRHDYYAARQEATTKNRPIFLHFYSPSAFDVLLDRAIEKDAELVRTLNDKMISLKIDGEKEASLARVLGVQAFPTVFLALPNGKLFGPPIQGVADSAFVRAKAESLLSACAKLPPPQSDSVIQWQTDHEAARKLAKEKKRPLVLFFYSETSFYAIKQDRALLADTGLAKLLNDEVVPVKFVYEKGEKPFVDMGVERFPTFHFVQSDGKRFGSPIVGFRDPGELRKEVQKLIDKNKAPSTEKDQASKIEWRHDYPAARREARKKERPLVIFFRERYSYYCVRQVQELERDAELVKLLNDKVVPLIVDGDDEGALCNILRVNVFPTIVMTSPDGKIMEWRQIGFRQAGDFRKEVEALVEKTREP